ncbi:MAG: FAD-binding oxidoreductase [Alphaproteobacteria bacterium]
MSDMDGINALKTALPATGWTDDQDIITPHLTEWRDKYFGQTPLMLMPNTTDEASLAVKICAEHNLKLVPQGGNTGLVGGQTPKGEVLISMKRMTRIRDVNTTTNALIAEAGCTLLSVQETASAADRKFPLSLASEGSCTIGGNLSTNAGGVHVLKYGTTKDLVFGVEAVLPNGDIFNGLTSLRKDNTGYDLSRLFLGAEGTLGLITAASLKLFPRPGRIQRAMMGTQSPASALALLEVLRAGNKLAMFEVMPRIGLDLVTTHIAGQTDPFSSPHPWYVLVDWETDTEAEGLTLAEILLSRAMGKDLIQDAVIAQSEAQAARLLALRENMSAAQKFNGGSIKQDITIPLDRIPEFFTRADLEVERIIPGCRPIGFGHFGDGNIHYNIAQPIGADKAEFLSRWKDISDAVFDIVDSLGGSISAEHGIGIMKREDLAQRADPVKLAMLRSMKRALDPQNIMNPRVLI